MGTSASRTKCPFVRLLLPHCRCCSCSPVWNEKLIPDRTHFNGNIPNYCAHCAVGTLSHCDVLFKRFFQEEKNGYLQKIRLSTASLWEVLLQSNLLLCNVISKGTASLSSHCSPRVNDSSNWPVVEAEANGRDDHFSLLSRNKYLLHFLLLLRLPRHRSTMRSWGRQSSNDMFGGSTVGRLVVYCLLLTSIE